MKSIRKIMGLKNYRTNIRKNISAAQKYEPEVIDQLENEIALLFKHRAQVYGFKMTLGTRHSVAREILELLSKKSK